MGYLLDTAIAVVDSLVDVNDFIKNQYPFKQSFDDLMVNMDLWVDCCFIAIDKAMKENARESTPEVNSLGTKECNGCNKTFPQGQLSKNGTCPDCVKKWLK